MSASDPVHQYWNFVQDRNWDGVASVLSEDIVVDWPATGERITGRSNFVRVNSEYPEGWTIKVRSVIAQGNQVASDVEVPMEGVGVFRVGSFWTVHEGVIDSGVEYWVQVGGEARPNWRHDISEHLID